MTWATMDTLGRLESLPILPKPHPMIGYSNDAINTAASKSIIREIIRITGSVATRSDFSSKLGAGQPWNETLFGLANSAGVDDVAIYLRHPWEWTPPRDGDNLAGWQGRWGDELERMHKDLLETADQMAPYGLNGKYVIVGQEQMDVPDDPDARERHAEFHDAVYDIVESVFPDVEIVYYSRLDRGPDNGVDGWSIRPLYSGDEKGKYLCCDLYNVDWPTLRHQTNLMCHLAHERGKGEKVVPWTCLGRTFKWKPLDPPHSNESASFDIESNDPVTWQYVGRALNWENQAWVDRNGMPLFQRSAASGLGTSRIFAADVPFVVLWPGCFDHRADHEHWLSDFIAYVCGSTATPLPDDLLTHIKTSLMEDKAPMPVRIDAGPRPVPIDGTPDGIDTGS